jgi:hypothetical protein
MFNPNEHLMDLKGKKYLQVMWRLVWFREDKPLWSIDTKLEQLTENHAVFSAKIYDENGVQKSAGYGSEGVKDFRDFIEKAETKAVGRALAMLGYGTQFAPELDEEERIVDSPVPPKKDPAMHCADCGAVIKSYKGQNGKPVSVERHCTASYEKYGRVLCLDCIKELSAERDVE